MEWGVSNIKSAEGLLFASNACDTPPPQLPFISTLHTPFPALGVCQAGERGWKQAAPSPIAWQQAVKIAQASEESGSTDTADSEHWPESQGLV